MISELKFVTVGVSSLERAIDFYRDAFGYNVIGTGELGAAPTPFYDDAWAQGRTLRADYAVVGVPGMASGMMRLVAFDAPSTQIWGTYARPGDHGLYAVNYRVPDMAVGWPRVLAAGARPRSEPHTWQVDETLTVHDCMCFDPDGTLLDVFEIIATGPTMHGDLTRQASEVQNVVVHTADADRCRDFYAGLGYTVNQDKTLEGLESFLKLPPGTALRNLNLAMNHLTPNGRIEISQYVGVAGRRVNATLPALGILAMTFRADDFEDGCAKFVRLGATAVGQAYRTVLPPFGLAQARLFEGPDGERLEVFATD
ncbi:MAG: VOC family protein [Alphaproteobacteria bacterium]|nr:VOC family protein [Alphaproteobacteria bacterium]